MNTKMYLVAFILLSVAFIIKRVGKSPSIIGKAGENKVARILDSLPREYKVLNNVIIPNQRGTSQIDHIVVSPYGIFVIETKNYEGWIFGSENSEQWKQTFKTAKGHDFYNPIKQNWGHIYALSSYLNINKRVFKSIIVFSNKATLKITTDTPVIHMSHLKREILSYSQEIIPGSEVDSIYNSLIRISLTGTENEKRHVQSVKQNVEEKQRALRSGICPRCGGELVLRKGKYGDFYGCSNYPKCKFTQNIRK